MPDRWSFRAFDLKTGVATADLVIGPWTHEERLSDKGSWDAQIVYLGDLLDDRAAIDATLVNRSLVVPYRDGLPLGPGCIVWAQNWPQVGGAGMLSYFDGQPYFPSGADITTFVGWDQHALMVYLVDWVQNNGGDIQIDTSQAGLSGVPRTQTWKQWDAKIVGEALRQKADNLGGYDFDFRIELDDAGLPVRRMRMWTPRRGRAYFAGSPVFTVGDNAYSAPAAPADGSQMVTEVIAVGVEVNSTTRQRQVYRYVNQPLIDAGYPRMVKVLNLNDVGDPANVDFTSLAAAAQGWAAKHLSAAFGEIVIDVNPDDETWPWGTYELGDDCKLVIPPPRPAGEVIVPADPAHIHFPAVAGNYATVPLVPPADAVFDVRFACRRPPNPAGSTQYRWTDTPFYVGATSAGILFSFLAQDSTFPAVSVTYSQLDIAGLPAVGEIIHTRMTWNPTTDVLSAFVRSAAEMDRPLDDSAGWGSGVGTPTTFAGKALQNSLVATYNLGNTGGVQSMLGDVYRWWIRLNGVTVIDVNMPNNIPDNLDAASFTATTGQTVSVVRTGANPTKLVDYAPAKRFEERGAFAGDPKWPSGLDLVRRIVGFKWLRGTDPKRPEILQVTAGAPL